MLFEEVRMMNTSDQKLGSTSVCSVFFFFFFFLIEIHSMQGWTATTRGMELQEKKHKKDYRVQKIYLERTYS